MTQTYEHAVIHSIAGSSVTMQTATSQKTLGKASSKDPRPGTNLGGFLEQLDLLSSQEWEMVNVDLHDHLWTILLRRRVASAGADAEESTAAPSVHPLTGSQPPP